MKSPPPAIASSRQPPRLLQGMASPDSAVACVSSHQGRQERWRREPCPGRRVCLWHCQESLPATFASATFARAFKEAGVMNPVRGDGFVFGIVKKAPHRAPRSSQDIEQLDQGAAVTSRRLAGSCPPRQRLSESSHFRPYQVGVLPFQTSPGMSYDAAAFSITMF